VLIVWFLKSYKKIKPSSDGETIKACLEAIANVACPDKKHIKVKLSLCFNWAPCHKGILGEWRYSSTHSLTSALDGGRDLKFSSQ